MEILVATHNNNKRREIKSMLRKVESVKVMSLNDLVVQPPMIVEDGKTFRQNAVKKAVTISRFFEGLVLADDSGLEVDALDGKPGVRSARFARTKATDEENNAKLLKLLGTTPKQKRTARFVCHIAVAKDGHLIRSFEGDVKGQITFKPSGDKGFGYDPLFIPEGYEKTFAEMTPGYKNRISHRSAALKQLKKELKKIVKEVS
ncbi:MAG: XTP/dITP diphosphatase [Candidatus Omnitrophica bacterium]|nr:XTP/dITP diphosphatase [Candidatus Omnitrophota bacterium]